jgi:large subunit ribosomal protein L22e/Meckel syndrome type 1 protein
MKRILLAVVGILAPLVLTGTPALAQSARHYDCTKPGNANKAVCKGVAAAAAAPMAPAAAAARRYDCSKAGNAAKAPCRGATPPPVVAKAAPTAPIAAPATRHYDCSKVANANKVACKGTVAAVAPAPAPHSAPVAVPAARPAPIAPAARAPVAGQNTNPAGPNGATAKCRDGTMSFSAHRSGTCSRHRGVAQFY